MATAELNPPPQLPRANVRPPVNGFPDSEFVNIPNVPVFKQHTTVSSKGRPLAYGYRELVALANRSNQRVQTGDYGVLTLRHTPTKEQVMQGATFPPIIGFAGPFRAGVMGEGEQQEYVLLADFHVFREYAGEVKRNPRRSAEVMLADRYEDQFIDVVALLGSETPRLDLGLFYSMTHSDREVERYSAAGAACPSASNVFIPDNSGGDGRHHNLYGSGTPADPSQPRSTGMPLAPEDVKQIVDAMEEMPWVKEVKSMLQERRAPGAAGAPAMPGAMPPGGAPAAPPAAPAAGAPPAAKPDKKEEYGLGGAVAGGTVGGMAAGPAGVAAGAGAGSALQDALAGDKSKNAVGSADGAAGGGTAPTPAAGSAGGSAGNNEAAKYSRMSAEFTLAQRQIETLQAGLDLERGKRIDAERYSALSVKRQYFSFDLDKEIERCRYSKMNDTSFNEHLGVIDANYRQIPQHELYLPAGNGHSQAAESTAPAVEKYSREVSEKAFKLGEARALRGEPVDYGAILEEVSAGRL